MEGRAIRLRHFETLKPVCPLCRQAADASVPLAIQSVQKQSADTIIEAILICTSSQCLSEYPVIDGIPFLVANLRAFISQNIFAILGRTDFSSPMESLLGDCCGPGSAFDLQRQHLSTYCSGHYDDLDPEREDDSVVAASVKTALGKGLENLGQTSAGPVIDLGCSVGRTSFELAGRFDDIVLGIDLNFDMLRTARNVCEKGMVSYPRRRSGLVYDRKEFPVAFEQTGNLDFWLCDATSLPFREEIFSLAVSMNLIDCVSSPYNHLKELARVLQNNGTGLLATPYDWSAGATPVEAWLGGHSQRSENLGAPEAVLRSLLAGGGNPNALQELALVYEDEASWRLRLHDRSAMEYKLHLLGLKKNSACNDGV